jgi:hypothetical protein
MTRFPSGGCWICAVIPHGLRTSFRRPRCSAKDAKERLKIPAKPENGKRPANHANSREWWGLTRWKIRHVFFQVISPLPLDFIRVHSHDSGAKSESVLKPLRTLAASRGFPLLPPNETGGGNEPSACRVLRFC